MPHAIKEAEVAIRIPDLPEPKTNRISIPLEADHNGENAMAHISRRPEFDNRATAAQASVKRGHNAPITERVKVARRARSDSSPSAYRKAKRETIIEPCTEETDQEGNRACNCPERTETPDSPNMPPQGTATESIRMLIVRHYASSIFNTCKMQAIPVSTGEPVWLHVSKDYKPKNHTKPADVSLHLREAVRLELERDLRIGVLRKVLSEHSELQRTTQASGGPEKGWES